jgi:DNA-binding CsgD family transcriptional regulator
MARTHEFEFSGEKFKIKRFLTSKGPTAVVSCPSFIASITQLKIIFLETHGYTRQETADTLGISLHTVKNHHKKLIANNQKLTGEEKTLFDLSKEAYKRELVFPCTMIIFEQIANEK